MVWCQNNLGSNGREETSPAPLLLRIKVTYIILKNKPWRNWPHKPRILMVCIEFYCDMKPASKTVVPWLMRTTLSTVLYKIDVCMKLFNMASPKFDERGGTNMQSIKAAHGLRSVMASGPGDRRLYYKKKTMATKVTLEINFAYLWSPPPCTPCKEVLMWVNPTLCERGETNREARLPFT
jgi:hypothetical protein